jgi:uncharacterized membrane protein (UPF0182 family)
VAGGLLYVEPMYTQQKNANAFPQLAQVLVSFGNKVGLAPTIDAALDKVFGAGTGQTATKPDDNSTSTSTSNPSSTSSTSTTTTTPPAGGGSSTDLDTAIRDIEAALVHLRNAQQSGDFTEQGKALAELDAASKRFDAAKAKQSTSSSPTTSPTPTPPGNGGG